MQVTLIHNVPELRHFIALQYFSGHIGAKLRLIINQKPLMENIDFLIRFENLNDDFKELCQNINISMPNLPHRNQSIREHYSIYYDDELIELVAQKYKEEIELGNYSFEKEN